MFNKVSFVIVLHLLFVVSIGYASTVAYYRFESDNGQDVVQDQFTTATSRIDDLCSTYHGTVQIPSDGGYPLRYRYSFGTAGTEIVANTGQLNKFAMYSYAQNYGDSDRWVDLGQGKFDSLDSFTVECWISLVNVWNYLYDEEKVWHFVDENGQASFELRIKEASGGTSPGQVQFVHKTSSGAEYIVSANWEAGLSGWAHVAAVYNKQAGNIGIYYNGTLAATTSDSSNESLGDGTNADWHYYLMGGLSDHGKTFYGAIDEFRISDGPLDADELLVYAMETNETYFDIGFENGEPQNWTVLNSCSEVSSDNNLVIDGEKSLHSDTTSESGTWLTYLRTAELPVNKSFSVEIDYRVIESPSYFYIFVPSSSGNLFLTTWQAYPGYQGREEFVFTHDDVTSWYLIFGMKYGGEIVIDNIVVRQWDSEQDAKNWLKSQKVDKIEIQEQLEQLNQAYSYVLDQMETLSVTQSGQLEAFISQQQIQQEIEDMYDLLGSDTETVLHKIYWIDHIANIDRDVSKLKAYFDYFVTQQVDTNVPFLTYSDNALVKIRRDVPYDYSDSPIDEVNITAAKNEYESFQVVVLPMDSNVDNVTISVTDLVLEGNSDYRISSDNIKNYEVRYVQTTKQLYPTEYVGWWPDPLFETNTIGLDTNNCSEAIWFTVYVPTGLYSGRYSGIISLVSGVYEKQISLSVDVRNFILPKYSSYRTAFGVGGSDSYRFSLLEHRISPKNIGDAKIILKNDNSIELDFTDIRSRIIQFLEKGLNAFTFGPYWGWHQDTQSFTVYPEGSNVSVGYPLEVLSQEFDAFMVEYFSQWADFLREEGLIGMEHCYIYDEPSGGEYDKVRHLLANVKAADSDLSPIVPGIPRIGNQPDEFSDLGVMCPLLPAIDTSIAAYQSGRGQESWWYVCLAPKPPYPNLFIDMPSTNYRLIPWMSWKYDVTGLLYWATTFWSQTNPWNDPETYTTTYGDGCLFYPPLVSDEVIPSIRLEVLRDGIEDYDYLAILRECVDNAQSDADFDCQELIAQANAILEIDDNIVKDVEQYTQNSDTILAERNELAELIEEFKQIFYAGKAAAAYYRFETDNSMPVVFDQQATATSQIDDETGNYNATVKMPTDDGCALMYRDAFFGGYIPGNRLTSNYGLWSYAQNYGNTDRWIDLGHGTFDHLTSFTVECWVTLGGVWNYKYDDEVIWSFADTNGSSYFDLRINEAPSGASPGELVFTHVDHFGNQASVSGVWTASLNDWIHVAALYDYENGVMQLYYNGILAGSVTDNSAQSLGDGFASDWHYQIMGGYSSHYMRFYGAVDEFRVTEGVLEAKDLLVNIGADIDRDNTVCLPDLAIICQYWLEEDCQFPFDCSKADLNDDGKVSKDDIMMISESWLETLE